MEARGAFSRYALVRKIASGGMATVYLGRDSGPLGTGRTVAIKVCHPHLVDAIRKDALLDEARVAARIRHPNVVETFDAVPRDGTVWIVMEHVEGVTVAGLLRARDSALPFDVALRIAFDTLAGLEAVHAIDVVHRDVSPQNILLGVDGAAKLADFGVFKGKGRIAPSTETGDLKGKLGYVAPEIYRGESITASADLYALGVVLWEMLAGRRLFEEDTHAALMHRALRGWVPAMSAIRKDVPAAIDGVLARALAPDPAERWASASEFADGLAAVAKNAGVAAVARSTLGRLVRDAMREAPIASSDHDSLTPNEYETPISVRLPRAPSLARTVVLAASGVALIGGIAAYATQRPAAVVARPSPAAPPPLPVASLVVVSPTVDVSALPPAASSSTRRPPPPPKAKPRAKEKAPFFDPTAP